MIRQNAQVVRCQDDRIWVRMGSQTGCVACHEGHGCGAGLFAKLLHTKPVIVELARNDMSIEPGQMLVLCLHEKMYIKLVLELYGWPLLAALAGAFAGHGLSNWLQFRPVWVDIGALFGGLLSAVFVVNFMKSRRNVNTILNSMSPAVYYPAETPNMCNRSLSK